MQIRFEFKRGYEEVTERNWKLLRESWVEKKTATFHVFSHEKSSSNKFFIEITFTVLCVLQF